MTLTQTKMDDIKDIVSTIVRGCAQGGLEVSDVLAAFIARTVWNQYNFNSSSYLLYFL